MAAGGSDVLERARQLRLAGLAHNSAGRPRQAARSLRAALRLLPPAAAAAGRETRAVRVACLLTLAMAELATDGFEAATARLEEARLLAGADPELVARYRCQRGNVLGRAGHFAAAVAELEVVLAEPGWFTLQERAATLLNRGMVNFELGRPVQAELDFAAAAALARESGDDRYEFMAQHNRGYARYLTGDLPGALAAMAAAEESPADVFRGPSLFDLARVLEEAGLLDEAIAALDQARAACRPRQHRILRAEIDLERARILRLTGEFDEAAAAARAARTRFNRLGVRALAARSDLTVLDCDLSRGRRLPAVLAGALADEQLAAEVGDGELQARSVAVAAEAAARLGLPDQARQALRRYPPDSFGLIVHLRHVHARAITELAAGRAPRRLLAAAARDVAASQAVSASLDSRAARKVLGLRLAALDVDLALRKGPTAVLESLERWTATGLPVVRPPVDSRQAELTAELRASSLALRDAPDAAGGAARRTELARLQRELAVLGLAQRQQEVGARDPLPPLAQALDQLAAAGRDLLWLFPHSGGLWGVGVSSGRRRLHRLADLDTCLEVTRRLRADLRAAAHQPTGPLRASISASLTARLAWLDDHVVRPWNPASGLVVVGTHAVASVPWGMLPSIAGTPVTVARSATEWAGRRRNGAPLVEVLVGPGLEHAAAEAAALARTWPAARLHPAATTSDLAGALARAEVVHLAAHGRHHAASPLFSSLRLHDGDAYAHELPAGQVRAGHVVLSACDVGTAEVRPGDEPLGLAATLIALGVSSVVAAVAPVADETAAETMSAYHSALARGLATDEALATVSASAAFVALGSTWQVVLPGPARG